MNTGPRLGVAELEGNLAGFARRVERGHEVVVGGRRVDAELVQLGLVVEEADDLAHLGQAVQLALAVYGAVVAVHRERPYRVGEAVEPAVRLGVIVEGDQQVGADVLAHLGAAVVGLYDVRRVVTGERQPQCGLQVLGGAGDPIDGDVRVLLLEGGVELFDLLGLPAADLLVPDGEGDLTHLSRVGLDVAGARLSGVRLSGVRLAGLVVAVVLVVARCAGG